MDPGNQSRRQIVRSVISLSLVFGLLHLANSSDILSDLTRPLVVGLLQFLGHAASDQEGYLIVGRLQIPWTRDCAGLNVLTILWAVFSMWFSAICVVGITTWLETLVSLAAKAAWAEERAAVPP